jgi:hypothetical protein
VQVRAGRVAGHADVGDVLARGHRVAGPHVELTGPPDAASGLPGRAPCCCAVKGTLPERVPRDQRLARQMLDESAGGGVTQPLTRLRRALRG